MSVTGRLMANPIEKIQHPLVRYIGKQVMRLELMGEGQQARVYLSGGRRDTVVKSVVRNRDTLAEMKDLVSMEKLRRYRVKERLWRGNGCLHRDTKKLNMRWIQMNRESHLYCGMKEPKLK